MSLSHKPSRRALIWALLLICLAVMNAAPDECESAWTQPVVVKR